MKNGTSEKVAPGYQKTSGKTLCPVGKNKRVSKPSGPGAGGTHGGPSPKVVTRIKT